MRTARWTRQLPGCLAERELPHLIVMDIMMSEMDGLTAIRQLKKTEATKDIPVIVIATSAHRMAQQEAELAGARIQKEQLQASMRSQDQIIEVDVRNAAQAVETSRRRVLAAREARANAEMQLEGEQRLYQVGRSTTFLLFQRENALTNARNAELRAETDYNKAIADLQRATSTTLRANNIVVDVPTP